jgi:hypothetical protein
MLLRKMVLLVLAMAPVAVALAFDGFVQGRIGTLEITSGDNFAFRVHMVPETAMCGNQYTYAYLNEADSNYKVYVAAIIAARQAGDQVQIYTALDSSAHCKIVHLAVLPPQ